MEYKFFEQELDECGNHMKGSHNHNHNHDHEKHGEDENFDDNDAKSTKKDLEKNEKNLINIGQGLNDK